MQLSQRRAIWDGLMAGVVAVAQGAPGRKCARRFESKGAWLAVAMDNGGGASEAGAINKNKRRGATVPTGERDAWTVARRGEESSGRDWKKMGAGRGSR